MNCANCGAELSAGWGFCIKCGKSATKRRNGCAYQGEIISEGGGSNFEDKAYDQVGQELETNNVDRATWTKAFAMADGDDKLTRSRYIRLRVERLLEQEGVRLQTEREISKQNLQTTEEVHPAKQEPSELAQLGTDRYQFRPPPKYGGHSRIGSNEPSVTPVSIWIKREARDVVVFLLVVGICLAFLALYYHRPV